MRSWLRQPVAMSRLTMFAITFFLGCLGAAGIVAGAAGLRHSANERDRAIASESLTRKDVADIARRIILLETPSQAELIRRVELALRACAREPRCSRTLRDVARRSTSVAPADSSTRRLEPSATGRPSPARRDGSGRVRPPATRRRDRRDASPSPGGSDPSPSPGPSRPNVDTPALPEVGRPALCTPVVGVNC